MKDVRRPGRQPARSFVECPTATESTNQMRSALEVPLARSALDDDSGQDLLEYALLVALIAVVAVGAVTTVGTTINTVFWTYISGVMSAI
jgi:pilus assembly protein Flp/PilA